MIGTITRFLNCMTLVVALSLLVACGQRGAPASSSGIGAARNKIDPCTLISKAEAEAAVGEPLADGRNHLISESAELDRRVSSCYFDATNSKNGLFINLFQLGAQEPDAAQKIFSSATMTAFQPIAGIGDQAFWGKATGATENTLFVLSTRHNLYLTIHPEGLDEVKALEAAKTLVSRALARLP